MFNILSHSLFHSTQHLTIWRVDRTSRGWWMGWTLQLPAAPLLCIRLASFSAHVSIATSMTHLPVTAVILQCKYNRTTRPQTAVTNNTYSDFERLLDRQCSTSFRFICNEIAQRTLKFHLFYNDINFHCTFSNQLFLKVWQYIGRTRPTKAVGPYSQQHSYTCP